jgi:hypothetical protein
MNSYGELYQVGKKARLQTKFESGPTHTSQVQSSDPECIPTQQVKQRRCYSRFARRYYGVLKTTRVRVWVCASIHFVAFILLAPPYLAVIVVAVSIVPILAALRRWVVAMALPPPQLAVVVIGLGILPILAWVRRWVAVDILGETHHRHSGI